MPQGCGGLWGLAGYACATLVAFLTGTGVPFPSHLPLLSCLCCQPQGLLLGSSCSFFPLDGGHLPCAAAWLLAAALLADCLLAGQCTYPIKLEGFVVGTQLLTEICVPAQKDDSLIGLLHV